MTFLYYWLIAVLTALLASLERYVNGYSGMFWAMICFAVVFLVAALGTMYKDDEG